MADTGMLQGMKQSMAATPAMQLYLQALQANRSELDELVAKAISGNPALEKIEPLGPSISISYDRYDTGRNFALESLSSEQTLADYLEEQIRQSGLSKTIQSAAVSIIPYLNKHGFFAESPKQVQEELGLSDSHFRQARRAIFDLDPSGVGAADLRESLMIQLYRLGESRGLPMKLLRHHWEALVRHRYAEIARALDVEEEAAELAAKRIARLNPDPGSGFSHAELNIITPDLILEYEGHEPKLHLTADSSPQVVLSSEYREMMAEHADKPEVRSYLSRCFREGRELIRALGDRKTTLLLVAKAIAEKQAAFFLGKAESIKPLKMEEVAEATQLHISTISRAVRGKYMQTPRGVFELRSLFTTALNTAADTEMSADEIKSKIRRYIEEEDTAHPLSDAKLEALLQQENITVARRTIAKYREQMRILSASLRKRK